MPDPDATHPQTSISVANIAWLAREYFAPGDLYAQHRAVAIALAESGGDYLAHNTRAPDDSYGLWQINMRGSLGPARRALFGIKKNSALFDPHINAVAAGQIYRMSGFRAWSTYTSGAYLRYMNVAWEALQNPKKPVLDPKKIARFSEEGKKALEDMEEEMKVITPDDVVGGILGQIFGWIGEGLLRVAGFVGGALLIIMAIVIVSKKGVK